jgi:hypothetical protein
MQHKDTSFLVVVVFSGWKNANFVQFLPKTCSERFEMSAK